MANVLRGIPASRSLVVEIRVVTVVLERTVVRVLLGVAFVLLGFGDQGRQTSVERENGVRRPPLLVTVDWFPFAPLSLPEPSATDSADSSGADSWDGTTLAR